MKIFLNFTVKILKYVTVEYRKYVTGSSRRPFLKICYGFFTIFRGKFVYVTRNISVPHPHISKMLSEESVKILKYVIVHLFSSGKIV